MNNKKKVRMQTDGGIRLPAPWTFVWEKDGGRPTVLAADGRVVATLSTGTIEGPYDPKDVQALGEAIAALTRVAPI